MNGFMSLNLQLLRVLETLRTPFGDSAMTAVTQLGEEAVFLLAALTVLWCVDKKKGYFLLTVSFGGLMINQILKLAFRIPRPWVLDSRLTIVEAARAGAEGWSFPSGHAQNAASLFGSIAVMTERKYLRVLCIIAAAAVAFSRMYLGVHTPLDVGVSLAVGALLAIALYPSAAAETQREGGFLKLWLFFALPLAAAFVVCTCVLRAYAQSELAYYAAAVKNAWCMFGAIAGIILVDITDRSKLHFDTRAVWWAQILKVLLGAAFVMAVRAALKAPLYALLGQSSGCADGVRYFLMVLAAGIVWPMSFPLFARLGRPKCAGKQ